MEKIEEKVEELLIKLVEIESRTEKEKKMSDYVASYCRKNNFDKVFQDKQGNVNAVIDCGKGKVLNFNAHMDTVSGFWKPELKNGKVFGRGTADMKGAIAAMLFSAKKLIKIKDKLNGKIVYSFVVCEESGNPKIRAQGSKATIEFLKKQDLEPTAVIVGESSQTDLENGFGIVFKQRGRFTADIDFFGSSAHGSFGVKKGANSFILASRFCQKMYNYAKNFDVSNLSVNIAGAETKSMLYNKVPEKTSVQMEMRFSSDKLLEEAEEKIREFSEQAVKEMAEELKEMKNSFISKQDIDAIGYKFVGECLHNGVGNRIYGPFDSSKSNFLKFVLNETEKEFGKENVKMNTSIFGTDAAFYADSLFKGVPDILVLGPGSQLKAHTSDEFIEIDHLEKYTELYIRIACAYLTISSLS